MIAARTAAVLEARGISIASGNVKFLVEPRRTVTCSACRKADAKGGQRYCAPCHAAYMRAWRRMGRESHARASRSDLPPERRPCSICREPRGRRSSRLCLPCQLAYARLFRTKHRDLDEEARRRANARAMANSYLRRGRLLRQPCRACGAAGAQMHHRDYSRPLDVEWLCKACHRLAHGK